MDINAKLDELGRAFEAFKSANDQAMRELKAKGSVDPTLQAKVDKANDEVERLSKEKDAMLKEIDGIKTALNRPGAAQGEKESKGDSKELKNAFQKFLRKGDDRMSPEELKALSGGTDADGGYLVRPELSDAVIQKVFESSPMRALASVQLIGTDVLDIITDLDEAASGWVLETAARAATGTPQVGKLQIQTHELYANPASTQKLLDDAMFDAEAWLTAKVAEKFARDEATAFISGDGTGKPKGILAYAAGTGAGQIEQVVSGNAALVTADGLVDLVFALKEAYAKNASFLMRRATVKAIRKLKDSNGNYLWSPGLSGTPATILDRPVVEAADMPAVAANALAIAFGDFKQAYQIVDRVGIRVLRDPYTNKPYVHFYTTKRVGGGVVNFEALKIQKISV